MMWLCLKLFDGFSFMVKKRLGVQVLSRGYVSLNEEKKHRNTRC